MLRFVDVREAEVGGNFAFFDTVTDRFISVLDEQVWDTAEDFQEAALQDGLESLDRFMSIIPYWAFVQHLSMRKTQA